MVWLVYARVPTVIFQASSHPSPSSSMSMRISSGTAIDGCVSFIWMATRDVRLLNGFFDPRADLR